MTPAIRPATIKDLEGILSIYNHYVAESTATFDLEPRSPDAGRAWLLDRSLRHPIWIAEESGLVVGWASLGPWSHHGGYRDTCELSIYAHPANAGKGLGSALLHAIMDHGTELGHHCIIARVCTENPRSRAFHERSGFKLTGTQRQVGRKHGRLLDVDILQKLLE